MQYSKKLKTIRINQKIGTFFLTKMTPFLLNKIANKNLSVYKDEVNGLQREKDKNKISEIKKYLKEDKYASFPNTIIIAIRDDLSVEEPLFIFDEDDNLSIAYEQDIANIIDGQHRLAGFDENDESFELPVTVFINLPLGEQAKLFAKINSTQTKVNLDIVYENFFKSNERSREKTSYFVVKTLNEKYSSPWFGRIKTLSDRSGDLAQGSMAKFIDKRLLSDNGPLNDLYINERDQEIFNILFNYFSAVKETFPIAWENKSDNYILTKTTGFNGFMLYLIELLKREEKAYGDMTISFFKSKFEAVKNEFKEFTNENYPSGAIGQRDIKTVLNKAK